eukprot:CAMPEP_0204348764 /NCGR_PEP_ID=MMETSP0469-20131031/28985_1 /ASSEMBLY_ACC=CAM_ASM_000384 /TAXON_ID=2969 /ORGANISM="Oxyrrhis marina" /LENGTH=217 /DNA_ID=CAMNT_0051334805 /DNA_START=25 /DNA_END=675 /DNA_ORIENTATION=+
MSESRPCKRQRKSSLSDDARLPVNSVESNSTSSSSTVQPGDSQQLQCSENASVDRLSQSSPQRQRSNRNLLAAVDRAVQRCGASGSKHHELALRRAKKSMLAAACRGDTLDLSVLHALHGVSHWVVARIRDNLQDSDGRPEQEPQTAGSASSADEPVAWWYLDSGNQTTVDRANAEVQVSVGNTLYRVLFVLPSGQTVRAWLPQSKAPVHCTNSACE